MTRGTFPVRRRPASKAARPAGSWGLSVERAREAWDALVTAGYSETAAAAILRTAADVWSDTAATLADDGQQETRP